MVSKKIFNSVLALFFLCIFSVPVFWLARGGTPPQRSLIEGRKLEFFPPLVFKDFKTAVKRILQGRPDAAGVLFFDQFLNRKYQINFEKAAADQIPLRRLGILIAKAVDRQIIELAYSPLKDAAIPADMKSGLYIMRDMPVIINGPNRFGSSTIKVIDQRIANYVELINANPDVNFYLLYHQRLSYSEFHPLNQYFSNPDLGRSLSYFEENKPDGLILEKMMLTGFEDHLKYYFKTEHHWNIHGALKAYDIIYTMLSRNYPDNSPALQHDKFYTFPDIQFLGSWSRETFYPMEGEEFEVAIIDLPPYRILQDGEDFAYTRSEEYLAGNYSIEPYISHYCHFYGNNYGLLEFQFDNDSDRNLLIIGNSYANPLEPLLASHYHITYSLDLRYYEDFSLADFLSNHPVSDILIIGDNAVAFGDPKGVINP